MPSVMAYEVDLHLFYGYSCPHCAKEKEFLDSIENKYPELNVYLHEIYKDKTEAKLYKQLATAYGEDTTSVPGTFIGDQLIIGYADHYAPVIEELIAKCINESCIDPLTKIDLPSNNSQSNNSLTSNINLPFFGQMNISQTPLIISTAIIAFVDGFNPCSLWVLTFLLGIVIYSGSRKKTFIVGITFLLITSILYGAFILSIISVLSYVGYLKWIQVLVALVALSFGLINVKDYFWFKKGISLTISDKYKPKLFKSMRNVMNPDKSTFAMIVATIIMAGGVTLAELPCTSGFPTIWANMLASANVNSFTYGFLLLIYILIYLIDELVIFFIAVKTLKVTKFEEKHGRMLKLIGGMIMLALALALLFKPEIMNDIGGSILVFIIAIVLAFVIMLVHDKLKPKDQTIVPDESDEKSESVKGNEENIEIKVDEKINEEKNGEQEPPVDKN